MSTTCLLHDRCTRVVLQAAVDSYVEAQKAGSLSKAPLAAKV